MPTSLGKHVKRAGAHARGVGRHAAAVKPHRDYRKTALTVVLAAAIIIVPFSFNRLLVSIDQNKALDSSYSSRSLISDSSAEAIVPNPVTVPESSLAPEAREAITLVSDVPTASFTDRVESQMQNEVMPGGCELVSLDIVLDAMGLNTDIHQVVDEHLDVDGHFATGYSGNPYYAGGGYAEGIANAANSYLLSIGSNYHAYDLTGKSFDLVKAFILRGYPVLTWTTMGFVDPDYTGSFDHDREWYSNEHCVVSYGLEGGKVRVSDPMEGFVERDLKRFQEIYEACGSMAVVIY